VAVKGNPSAVSDAGVSALLADAACRGASYNVRINVAALSDASKGHALIDAAKEFVRETSTAAARVSAEVERHI
jgi:glutamate formiminotransferase/formiminotetrahydrofolate cyclodeaminase